MALIHKCILVSIFFCSLQAFAKEVFLDVRTPEEFSQEHIPGALNLNVEDSGFKKEVAKLERADSYKIYCRSGRRSAKAVSIMKELGFKDLTNLGGLTEAKKFQQESKKGSADK